MGSKKDYILGGPLTLVLENNKQFKYCTHFWICVNEGIKVLLERRLAVLASHRL
jgi:hypothetical protein